LIPIIVSNFIFEIVIKNFIPYLTEG